MRTRPHTRSDRSRGFTLVEAIVVIVLTGILAAVVAVFVRVPIQGYLDVARRAELTDVADTGLRRIARDLRRSLPNSIRVNGTTQIEFIPIKSAGRYREALDNNGNGNPLDFSNPADTSFDVIGPGVDIEAGDSIVIYNLGITGAEAYGGSNRRSVPTTSIGTGRAAVSFNGAQFPFASPARRFHVVGTPVSYICAGGSLTRYWGYAYGADPSTGNGALLATHVSNCRISYLPGLAQLNALVTLELQLTIENETVSLIHQVHVNNAP